MLHSTQRRSNRANSRSYHGIPQRNIGSRPHQPTNGGSNQTITTKNKSDVLPEIHKTPPGIRPIVSGCDGPTELISRFADYVLQPLARKQNSYIRDSKQFVQITESLQVPTQSFLVCIDVSSLYTNIPHNKEVRKSVGE